MEKTWRWFGPNDPIKLEMLRQIGVEGIVTSLHSVPNGEVWKTEDIRSIADLIASCGMRWSVVESLPVSEAIKFGGPDRDRLIDNYITSLDHLGSCGIRTVCYNFMPVIDWVRTDLHYPLPNGSTCLYFNYLHFAYFDLKVLCRKGAEADYTPEILTKVEALDATMTDEERHSLVDTLIIKTQGFINGNVSDGDAKPVETFRSHLAKYEGLDKSALRKNLQYFLSAVMPVCDKWDIGLCVHPDDPPMPVFGLPRIACNADDIRWMLSSVDNPHNGLTFCAGSLSSGAANDTVAMAQEFAPRTHFVHLRSCDVLPGGDFIEAPHTAGRANLVELCRIFTREERRRGITLPMRVDHGRDILSDHEGGYNPGYGFYGRMLALGQVDGMMAAVANELDNK